MTDPTPSTVREQSGHDAVADGTACDFTDVSTHTQTHETRAEFDGTTSLASLAVPELVGRLEGIDPCSLPSLYESVNPEALDELFADDRGANCNLSVTFDYAGYRVTVRDGAVSVSPAE
ncbi:hypothetical protein EGH21_02100 [Halomicroarcula sp. F13]|uniref:Halobacterial output domain-containing protein n=1 Tax=Haloarcula rubra TaxID=2487747 RepID=A0AAW4PL39_9EURY|nr:HalOD1 output domain-containing protein [Halomicroarcula rubra]MBX0321816.1 hypothetical protein [Halomicroarcula rubra]